MAQNTILNLYIKENILKINMKSMKKTKTLNYLNTVRSAEKNMAVFNTSTTIHYYFHCLTLTKVGMEMQPGHQATLILLHR